LGAIVLSGVVVLDEVESDSLGGGLDPVGGMRVEDPLKVIGVGHALLRRVPRALTGATVACAGWRRLIRSQRRRRERAAATQVYGPCILWRGCGVGVTGLRGPDHWCGVGVTGLRGPDH